VLLHADPLVTHPGRGRWEKALESAGTVVAFAEFVTDTLAEHATVIFPAEAGPEKEGTLTHPDGRLQRVRQAIGHQGQTRPEWSVLAELAERCGASLDVLSAPELTAKVTAAVPFYEGIDLEAIGGTGLRWQDTDAAAKLPGADLPGGQLPSPPELPEGLRLGLTHSIWADPVTEHAPSLRFLAPAQRAELSPSDAKRIGVQSGDRVEVSAGDAGVQATVAVRQAVQPGSVFLLAGTLQDNATALANGSPRVVEVRRVESGQRSPLAVVAAGGPDAEPPPS